MPLDPLLLLLLTLVVIAVGPYERRMNECASEEEHDDTENGKHGQPAAVEKTPKADARHGEGTNTANDRLYATTMHVR